MALRFLAMARSSPNPGARRPAGRETDRGHRGADERSPSSSPAARAARGRGAPLGAFLLLALVVGAVTVGGAAAETVRDGSVQVRFGGSVAPKALPRVGRTAVAVAISGRIRDLGGGPPPSLRRIVIEVNRLGMLDQRGLSVCPEVRLRATTTERALSACGSAKVGEGHVGGLIVLPEQAPTRFEGRVVAFNGRLGDGRPAILAHLYVTRPAPITFVLAFTIGRARGAFGTGLVATVPERTRGSAHITSFSLRLHRLFAAGGERRSYLSAGCPAPAGFGGAPFPLVRTSYSFDGEQSVGATLVRTCHVGG